MLVVGLGGGSLPLFVHDYFSQARVAVVEIDPSMLEVATHWFGFSQGDRMQVHISDGLDYVAKLAAEGTISQSIPGALSSSTLGSRVLGCCHHLIPLPALSPAVCHNLQPHQVSAAHSLSLPTCVEDLKFVASHSTKGL